MATEEDVSASFFFPVWVEDVWVPWRPQFHSKRSPVTIEACRNFVALEFSSHDVRWQFVDEVPSVLIILCFPVIDKELTTAVTV